MSEPAGRVVATAREAAGVSQAELARRMGVPAQSVSRLEHDVHSPSVRTLEKIADALGLELRIRFVRKPRRLKNVTLVSWGPDISGFDSMVNPQRSDGAAG